MMLPAHPTCGWEVSFGLLDGGLYGSDLCGRPADMRLDRSATGRLYLCAMHTTPTVLVEAQQRGWVIVEVRRV